MYSFGLVCVDAAETHAIGLVDREGIEPSSALGAAQPKPIVVDFTGIEPALLTIYDPFCDNSKISE